jgi:branched-chain amino acid transport system substrate-binding protein
VRSNPFRIVAALAAFALAGAACGDDDDGGDAAPAADDGTTTEATQTTAEAPSGEPIRLVVVAAVAGIVGQPETFDGADAAVAAVNAAGGVEDPAGGPNRPLEIIRCEAGAGGSTSPDAALECAQDSIEQGVVAVIGKYLIGADGTRAWQQANVPLVGTISIEAEDLTNPAVFPISGGAPNTPAGVGVALQMEGASSVAFVTGDIPAGRALATFLRPALENDADLVNETYVSLDPSSDYTPQLSQLASANPDGIAVVSSTDVNTRVISGLRQAGYTGLIGVPSQSVSEQMIEDLGDFSDGLVLAGNFAAITDDVAEIEQFNAEMEAHAADAARTEFSLNAWSSVHLVADVLAGLDAIDGASLLAALDGLEVDLGIAPPFTLGVADNPFGVPRVFRGTFQPQVVEDGAIVASGDGSFVDLNEIVG